MLDDQLKHRLDKERVKGFGRGNFVSHLQCIDWCRTRVDVLEEDVNEVEKDQTDGEPTNLFDDPSFETNESVHVDHQTHDRSFTCTFDT